LAVGIWRSSSSRGLSRLARAQIALVGMALAACGDVAPPEASSDETKEALEFLTSADFRRAALVESLTTSDNGYARLRLAHYESGDSRDWNRLPSWNPPARSIAPAEVAAVDRGEPLGAPDEQGPAGEPLPLPPDALAAADPAMLRALGEKAFFRYPVQMVPWGRVPLPAAEALAGGLWRSEDGGLGGLVLVQLADGKPAWELTCASCHAAVVDGQILSGLPNHLLDLGRLAAATLAPEDPTRAALSSWGPGRLDVSTEDGHLPVRIPDLRPTRWLTHLQADATVKHLSLSSLAVRLETLLITSHDQALRPPRLVALALAAYVRGLAETLPAAPPAPAVFAANCARCHAGPGLTGAPRPFEEVGTDPAQALSAERGTGLYRVPSLRGVSTRGPLLHDGSLQSIADLLGADRLRPDWARGLHGSGPTPGHLFGLDLPDPQRQVLLDHLLKL